MKKCPKCSHHMDRHEGEDNFDTVVYECMAIDCFCVWQTETGVVL